MGKSEKYYMTKVLDLDFDQAIEHVKEKLKENGFGILTEIDVQDTLKQKIGVDFRKYRILGACNPTMAHQALLAESHIGVMLPCSVIVQRTWDDKTEVSAINPKIAMGAVKNEDLECVAGKVSELLKKTMDNL